MSFEKKSINYPLLIVHGWDDYDRQFHLRIDKMWKEICPGTSGNDQINGFFTESKSRLNACIQNSGFTFVRRRTLMRFTLWMQIAIGVQIRSVQRIRFANEIKSYFRQSEISPRAIQSLALSPSHSTPATTTLGPLSPVPASTQRTVDRDRVCQSAASSTKLVPHSTPPPSQTQRAVCRDRVCQSALMSVEKKIPTSCNRDLDSVREARLKRFEKNSSDRQEQNPRT